MSKPKILKIFDTTTDEKIYSKLTNPVTVTQSGTTLVVSSSLTLSGPSIITFKAPCNSSAVNTITANGISFSIVNTLDKTVTAGNVFVNGAMVSMILDTSSNKAYLSGSSSAGIIVGTTAPTDTSTLWIDSTNNVLRYYSGSAWKISGIVVSSSAPADTSAIWLDSNNNVFKYYIGSKWKIVGAAWN